jgi:hypothetical protein
MARQQSYSIVSLLLHSYVAVQASFEITLPAKPQMRPGLHRFGLIVLFALWLTGCATAPPARQERKFNFQQDTFAFANELVWEYHFDGQTGARTTTRREPKPDYTLHCFVVAKAAKQFFYQARFAPELPKTNEAEYRKLVDKVIGNSPRKELPEPKKVLIPGYADLRSFSAEHEAVLKGECGGAWQSYVQRGHWRMIMGFSRGHQERMAQQLLESLQANRPTVVHVVRFPQLSINHAVLLFDAKESGSEIQFSVYDPNEPGKPTTLTFDRGTRTFAFPTNLYFAGGRVDVYEIYRGALY